MLAEDKERCETIAAYMIEKSATVRGAALHFGISKSTVHKDVTAVLEKENYALWVQVRELLEKNKAERHKRGGEATRIKYKLKKENTANEKSNGI